MTAPNIKRLVEMSDLERAVIQMIFDDVRNIQDDNVWRNYQRKFTFESKSYVVKCKFKMSNQYLTHKDLIITHDQETFILPQHGRLN